MKKHINKLWLAALPLAFAACQNEEVVFENTLPTAQPTQQVMSLKGVIGGGMSSRAQVVLGNQDVASEKFLWNEGDRFTVYLHKNIKPNEEERYPSTATFNIDPYYSDYNPSGTAEFTTTYQGLEVGDAITAIYPLRPAESTPIKNGCITLKIQTPTMESGTSEEWRDYFAQNMYMMAIDTLKEDNVELNFKHLTTLLRVTYTNKTENSIRIRSVALEGLGKAKNEFDKTIDLFNGNKRGGASTGTVSVNFRNLTIAPNESKDFYFLEFAGDINADIDGDALIVRIDGSNGTVRSIPLPYSKIAENNNGIGALESGKRYWFSVSQQDEDLLWDYTTFDIPVGVIENTALIEAVESRHGVRFNKDENGFVDVHDLHNYTVLASTTNLSLGNCGLTSLEGIEYFANITNLQCSNNQLTELDLSHNIKLTWVNCANNALTSLNMENCTKLRDLYCADNQLTELVLHSSDYGTLNCSNNHLTVLDLDRNNLNISHLYCQGNHIPSLDISKLYNYSWYTYTVCCGNQTTAEGDPMTLKLIIRMEDDNWSHPSQKPLWAQWISDGTNYNVEVEGITPTTGGGTADDLGNGGNF